MSGNSISSRVAVHRRYVRSVDVARDVDDPNALDGYVVTPSVRDAAFRIVTGLSGESRQRALSSRGSVWDRKIGVRSVPCSVISGKWSWDCHDALTKHCYGTHRSHSLATCNP